VDLYSVHEFDVMMLKAIAESGEAASVIVDLGGVTFMDLTGLRVLLRAHNRTRLAGRAEVWLRSWSVTSYGK
jgi:anti-anti-sigma factor